MNKLSEKYLADRSQWSGDKEECRAYWARRLADHGEVVKIEDIYYGCWTEDGERASYGNIVSKRIFHFEDGHESVLRPFRYREYLEPLEVNPMVL